MRVSRNQWLWITTSLLLAIGCDDRVHPPAINPAAAGEAAVSQYDKNSDAKISDAELDAVPGLKRAIGLQEQLQRSKRIHTRNDVIHHDAPATGQMIRELLPARAEGRGTGGHIIRERLGRPRFRFTLGIRNGSNEIIGGNRRIPPGNDPLHFPRPVRPAAPPR